MQTHMSAEKYVPLVLLFLTKAGAAYAQANSLRGMNWHRQHLLLQ
jgi:hypothetical protein